MDTLDQLRGFLPNMDLGDAEISDWTVAMQIQHILRARIGMYMALDRSVPGERKKKLTAVGRVILATGRFPRGRAKSPKIAIPTEGVSLAELEKLFSKAHDWDLKVKDLDKDSWFEHPYFGILDRDTTIKNVGMHDRHHIRIIEEIVESRS